MDMQSPDQDNPALPPTAFADVLEFTLATTLPVNPDDAPDTYARKLASAQRQFAAFTPTNEAEAQEAAAAVALMLGAVDSLARAAKPGVGGETAGRLRSNALSAIRFYATTLKNARKRSQPEANLAQPDTPPQDDKPLGFPKIDLFQPRDRRGNPIPAFRYDLLTVKQKRAAYDFANKAAWAEAIAEEDAAIAEQAEIDARSPPTEEQRRYFLPLISSETPPPDDQSLPG